MSGIVCRLWGFFPLSCEEHQWAVPLVRPPMPGLGAGGPSHGGSFAVQLFVVGHQTSPPQPDDAWRKPRLKAMVQMWLKMAPFLNSGHPTGHLTRRKS